MDPFETPPQPEMTNLGEVLGPRARRSGGGSMDFSFGDILRSVLPGYGIDPKSEEANKLRAFVRQQAYDIGMNLGPSAIAFHGSPHSFEKFDLSKIGTGEGAQAYGHGLYFAEKQGTAEAYKRALSDHSIEVEGKAINPVKGSMEDRAAAWVQGAMDAQPQNPFQYAKQQAYSILGKNSGIAEQMDKIISNWQMKGATVKPGGNLYKVDIPDEHIAKMLDWDKPLSQQPESVRKALDKALYRVGTTYSAKDFKDVQEVMRFLGSGSDKLGAAALNDVGIPGIKYLDQGSRSSGQGTRNFVLFDDTIPKIVGKE